MTREAYDPQRLDNLALRLLDLCGRVRTLSLEVAATEIPNVELHDRKALEWIEKLESWAAGAEADLHRQTAAAQGNRKGRELRERGL